MNPLITSSHMVVVILHQHASLENRDGCSEYLCIEWKPKILSYCCPGLVNGQYVGAVYGLPIRGYLMTVKEARGGGVVVAGCKVWPSQAVHVQTPDLPTCSKHRSRKHPNESDSLEARDIPVVAPPLAGTAVAVLLDSCAEGPGWPLPFHAEGATSSESKGCSDRKVDPAQRTAEAGKHSTAPGRGCIGKDAWVDTSRERLGLPAAGSAMTDLASMRGMRAPGHAEALQASLDLEKVYDDVVGAAAAAVGGMSAAISQPSRES